MIERKLFEKVDDNPGEYFGMLVEGYEDKEEVLKEDKFVPKDKMSKKAKKELNDKKRGTWGNTNPITKVQPNKKAYDRKRDSKVVDERLDKQSDFELTYVLDELEELSNYYRSRQDNWSKEDSEEFLKDINSLLHRTQHLFRKAKVLGESKELNEVRDFEWNRTLWAVVKDDGSFAGSPCLSWEEARELSVYHENSRIYDMKLDVDQVYSDEEDLPSYGIETGYYN